MDQRRLCNDSGVIGVILPIDNNNNHHHHNNNNIHNDDNLSTCVSPYRLHYTSSFVVPIYGFVSPAIILFTVLTNCLVCVVLLRPRMRSPTNALLVAMAVSDTLTGLCPLPCFLYFYSAGHHITPIPYQWCDVYFYLVDYLPTIFHTASIWLTVALAVQRYVVVCRPSSSTPPCSSSLTPTTPSPYQARTRSSCRSLTPRSAVAIMIISIYTAALISQFSRFFETEVLPIHINTSTGFLPVPHEPPLEQVLSPGDDYEEEVKGSGPGSGALSWSYSGTSRGEVPVDQVRRSGHADASSSWSSSGVLASGGVVVLCEVRLNDIVKRYMNVYFGVYYGFRVLFIHLLPCLCLIVMNGLLVGTMRAAQARRRLLLAQNRRSESRHLAESTRRTMMLTLVVGLFLLVELPLAVLFFITIVENAFDVRVIDPTTNRVATLFANFFILLSYPINFFIYCAMSAQFRTTFTRLFLSGVNNVVMSSTATAGGGGRGQEVKHRSPLRSTAVQKRRTSATFQDAVAIQDDGSPDRTTDPLTYSKVVTDPPRQPTVIGQPLHPITKEEEDVEKKAESRNSCDVNNSTGKILIELEASI